MFCFRLNSKYHRVIDVKQTEVEELSELMKDDNSYWKETLPLNLLSIQKLYPNYSEIMLFFMQVWDKVFKFNGFKGQWTIHKEASQMTCIVNHFTGFYMMERVFLIRQYSKF